jgi:hypothetical protein
MQIVENDEWLVDMWDTIRRFEDLAKNDGMYEDGLDLSYLGVYAIWNREFGNHRNRVINRKTYTPDSFSAAVESIVQRKGHPSFQGHKTKFPALRQLCLTICGWTFSKDRLRQRCKALMENGHHYKGIVVAVLRGFKDLAQELLREAIKNKTLQNIGLGAVIACEFVNEEQRELCEWMAEETDDPYLKALLAYFVSGDWKVVADMPLLPLSDRIGVAVKYLDDDRLGHFIKMQTATATVSGNTEGLVLTGLTDRALDLFHHYISKFNDLQTAVLALSFTCPVYVADASRFEMWKETYLMQMQSWRCFNPRAQYLDAHSRRSTSRNGVRFGSTPTRPVSLRCNNCLSVLAPHVLKSAPEQPLPERQLPELNSALPIPPGPPAQNLSTPASSQQPTDPPGALVTLSATPLKATPSTNSGLVCPHCGRRMPHCGICGLLLGSPEPRKLAAANALATTNGTAAGGARGPAALGLARLSLDVRAGVEDGLARQPLYCMACQHVFHGHHARDWFARHRMCPVPECQCMCGVLH